MFPPGGNIYKSEKSILGEAVKLKFKITQHSRDEQLLQRLISYLGCGNYYNSHLNKEWGDFIVSGFSDITELIIPFLDKYPIFGIKSFDFHDFKQVAGLMKSKSHLTTKGLNEINKVRNESRKKLGIYGNFFFFNLNCMVYLQDKFDSYADRY